MDAPVPVLEPVLPRGARRRGRARVVLALGALVAGFVAYLAWQLARPPLPVEPARIVVVDGAGRLVTMDRDGASRTPLDVPGVTFQFPAWSPDGSRIAAVGSDGDAGAVYVLPAGGDTGAMELLYTSDDRRPFYLSWSPDGSHVTFLTNEPDGIALRIAPADGALPATVVRRGAPMYWDWIDPERLLVHVRSGSPQAFLGEVDLAGTTLDAPPGRLGFFRAPAVGATGARAWIERDDDGGQALVVETRGGDRLDAIPADGSVAIAFEPTGTALAFIASDRAVPDPPPLPIGPLRVVDATDGSTRLLWNGPVMAFFWSPDGRTIAALEFVDPDDPAPGEARGGGRLASMRVLPVAAAEPSGLAARLLFLDVAGGDVRSDRRIRLTDLFAFQVLPFFDQYARSHRPWSPDGQSLVLPIAASGGPDRLVVFDADGDEPQPLVEGSIGFWSP